MERQYGSILFVLTAVFSLACGQVSPCILNRLNILNCVPRSSSSFPGQNEYAVYRTRIRTDPLDCRYRNPNGNPNNEIISAISTLGADDLRLIHSPGFVGGTSYSNRLVVKYNISCGPGRLAFYNITSLDLDPQVCSGSCVDYVEVDRLGGLFTTESSMCLTNNQLQIETSDFEVRFRSSDSQSHPGFQAYVICYDPMEVNVDGCTEVGSARKRRSVSWKEKAYHQGGHTPVASVSRHHEWHHQRYSRGIHNTADEILIGFGEKVQYRNQVIRIRTNGEVRRIFGVAELSVVEGSGEVKVFHDNAFSATSFCSDYVFATFSGPARLFVAAERAWLELLAFDPVGVVPTPQEAEIITTFTEEYFAMLDPYRDDVHFDPAGSGFGSGATNSTRLGRRKRQITGSDMISAQAILDAIANQNACNVVLRTSARVTLSIACSQDSNRVNLISGTSTCG